MAGIVPAGYLHLAEEGVTRLEKIGEDDLDGRPLYPDGAVEVRVRESFDARGQWVGSYSLQDAEKVADRLATALYGSVQAWHVEGEVTKLIVTSGGKLAAAATRWRVTEQELKDHVREAVRAGVSKSRVHQLTGVARTTIDRWLAEES